MSDSELIDVIVASAGDWRSTTLAQLRAVIRRADPDIVEEVKWRKPSRPMGVPVWSHDGIVCVADTLKKAVRLTFPHGAQVDDPLGVFNTRLDSASVRAVDYFEDIPVDEEALAGVVRDAVRINVAKVKRT